MNSSLRFMHYLKWFSILWTASAIAIVAISHLMIVYEWSLVTSLLPFDVKNSTKVALLLAPGAIAAAIHLYLEKTTRSG